MELFVSATQTEELQRQRPNQVAILRPAEQGHVRSVPGCPSALDQIQVLQDPENGTFQDLAWTCYGPYKIDFS